VIRLAVRVRGADAEIVLAELLELAPDGVEEAELDGGIVEYAVYGAPGELPSLPDLTAAAGRSLVEISTSETADDWKDRWRRFHRPILIEPGPASAEGARLSHAPPSLYVRPPWEAPAAAEGVEDIVIDPGQAFGTGAHATTRLCLELLLEMASAGLAGGPLLDVGTGSGVLAIAAARLGFAPVLALDHDPLSVEAARSNAAVNGVELAVERLDLRRRPLPWPGARPPARDGEPARPDQQTAAGRAGVVLANLLLPLLLDLAGTMREAPCQLVASGLLREQADEVVEAFASRFDLRERRRLQAGEWAAVWLSGA
jgi:ribosomal protein L11 methyltransferase